MDKKLDEFIEKSTIKFNEQPQKVKRKRLKPTKLDNFIPEEHINYFKSLRIGSKKIRNAKIIERIVL